MNQLAAVNTNSFSPLEMAKAQNASTVGIHLPNSTLKEIDRRAGILGYSRSRYAGAIIQRWFTRHHAEPIYAIEAEKLEPLQLPDGTLTWVGAELKPGESITDFTDHTYPEFDHKTKKTLHVAEQQATYQKKQSERGRARPIPPVPPAADAG